MGKYIDLTGQQFGELTVIERDRTKSGGAAYWLCKCSCGNPNLLSMSSSTLKRGAKTCRKCNAYKWIGHNFGELTVIKRDEDKIGKINGIFLLCKCSCGNPNLISIPASVLTTGKKISCGKCSQYNMIGKKFGRLTVLDIDKEYNQKNNFKNQATYYKVQCDCENKTIFSTQGAALRQGKTLSCGCYNKERITEVVSKDLTGQVFGYLKVLYRTNQKSSNGSYFWHCICLKDNNEIDVRTDQLTRGVTSSCGCIHSRNEAKIQQLLQNNNIRYVKEKTFSDLISDKNRKYRYDFYLPDYNRLIEFDGEQHFKYTESGWNTQENFERTQQRDQIKNKYALDNNYELVRIPYWEQDSITLETLLGDTFLINKEEIDDKSDQTTNK